MERIEELSRRILIVYLLRHRKFKPINDEHSYHERKVLPSSLSRAKKLKKILQIKDQLEK